MRRLNPILLTLIILMSASGCNFAASGGIPTVAFLLPADGAAVDTGEAVTIAIAASDVRAISRVDLFIDGVLFSSTPNESGNPRAQNLTTTWEPAAPGAHALTAIAYRDDSTASDPASITVTVGEGVAEAGPTSIPLLMTPANVAPPRPDGDYVKGRVIATTAVRTQPGPYCDVIGGAEEGTIINLMEYSADMQWLMTDILGEDQIGWVWITNIIITGDASQIPRGDRFGCLGCGDGTCSPSINENCFSCEQDCGECCGNGTCEGPYGETCNNCETDCGPCCGNDICEVGYDEDCYTCEEDCGDCCGNDVCDLTLGETCYTCSDDCGFCCGNRLCEADYGEDCATCAADCGACTAVPPTAAP